MIKFIIQTGNPVNICEQFSIRICLLKYNIQIK